MIPRHVPNCFVCGKDNPHGLRAKFRVEKDAAIGEFKPENWQEGGRGMLHGGLICALLDEAMAALVNVTLGVYAPTVSLEIRMRKPISLDEERIIVKAELIDKNERHNIYTAQATLQLPDGTLLALGKGKFLKDKKVQLPSE
ncbi:MAG: PaaI family thioesterase [Candidatus Omnitrophota bacterium]|nr:PaaI family thioesterase [Candidatus Omnitrophota bacterium]